MKDKLRLDKQNMIQLLKFALVGVSNTLVMWLLNMLTLWILHFWHPSWDYIAANVVSFFLCGFWTVIWNDRFVFKQEEGAKRPFFLTLLKTYVSYGLTGIVFNNILSWVWISQFGMSKILAPVINSVVSLPINFVMNKCWAYKNTPPDYEQS